MAPQNRASKTKKTKPPGARARLGPRAPRRHRPRLGDEAQGLNTLPLEDPYLQAGTVVHLVPPQYLALTNEPAPPATSHTGPKWLQACADGWVHHASLISAFNTHKRRCLRSIDPVAWQAVAGMDISLFMQPALGLSGNHVSGFSHAEDLNYSLRNFVAADPVQDPNALYARIAVREGRTMAGFVPALPDRGLVTKDDSEKADASEATDGGSEVLGD